VSLIQEIGSYAGLAAIPAIAVLSALYFSQARDVRRLRDWAGRAPERAAEHAGGGRVVARVPTPPAQPAAQPVAKPAPAHQPAQQPAAAAQPAAAKPAAAAAAAGAGAATASAGGGGTATATPPRPGAATPAGANAAAAKPAAAQAGGNSNSDGAKPAAAGPPRIPPRVPSASQTSVLGVGADPAGEPWYRRLLDRLPAPRYLAILLVGILVVGGGIAFGITQLGKDSGSSSEQTPDSSSSSSSSSKPASDTKRGSSSSDEPATVEPSDVNVSVLNGTTTTGLANSTGTDLESKGYNVLNRLNGGGGTVAESVVEYADGHEDEARQVAKELDISQIEPASEENVSLGGPDAEVIVVLGADRAADAPTP
jgi:hypothetical protein